MATGTHLIVFYDMEAKMLTFEIQVCKTVLAIMPPLSTHRSYVADSI